MATIRAFAQEATIPALLEERRAGLEVVHGGRRR
jgi:hypothetical protein